MKLPFSKLNIKIAAALLVFLAVAGMVYMAYSAFRLQGTPVVSNADIQAMAVEGKDAEAILHARKRLQSNPEDADTQVLLVNLYEKTAQHRKAEALYRALLSTRSQDAFLHFFLGRSLYNQFRVEEAIEEFEEAKKLASQYVEGEERKSILLVTHRLLSEIYFDHAKEYAKAVVELTDYLVLDPQSLEMQYNLATAYAQSEQLANAYAQLDKIIRENPGTPVSEAAQKTVENLKQKENQIKNRNS